jgi:hypothetical protein
MLVCLGTKRILILFATVFGFLKNKSDFISLFLILSQKVKLSKHLFQLFIYLGIRALNYI